MKIEKTPRGYLLSANGGNRIEFYREFNGVEAWGCAAFDELMKERDALRAKITEMEQQAPVMWANSSNINSSRINKERGGSGDQHTCSETQTAYHHAPLYALPGAQAQPATSVPDKVEVREDEGMIFSRGSYNEGYDNGWNDCVDAMLAAAPEAKL